MKVIDLFEVMILTRHPIRWHKISGGKLSFQPRSKVNRCSDLINEIEWSCEEAELMSGRYGVGCFLLQQFYIERALIAGIVYVFCLRQQNIAEQVPVKVRIWLF